VYFVPVIRLFNRTPSPTVTKKVVGVFVRFLCAASKSYYFVSNRAIEIYTHVRLKACNKLKAVFDDLKVLLYI
jgi:hypothetical protein